MLGTGLNLPFSLHGLTLRKNLQLYRVSATGLFLTFCCILDHILFWTRPSLTWLKMLLIWTWFLFHIPSIIGFLSYPVFSISSSCPFVYLFSDFHHATHVYTPRPWELCWLDYCWSGVISMLIALRNLCKLSCQNFSWNGSGQKSFCLTYFISNGSYVPISKVCPCLILHSEIFNSCYEMPSIGAVLYVMANVLGCQTQVCEFEP